MPRSVLLNQRLRDDRSRRILSTAARLFATQGLAATKISDIASAVGMSQGLLYHYFDSKETIFVEIVRQAFERMNTAARELEGLEVSPREKLTFATRKILRDLEQSDDFAWYSALISSSSFSEAIPAAAKEILRTEAKVPYEVVERIVRAGQRDGAVKKHKPKDLALVFWTTIKGLALHKVWQGSAFRSPDPDILLSLFFDKE